MDKLFRSFVKESPDYNFMILEGDIDKIAANRVVLCTITEFGIMNSRRMLAREYSYFIESIQMIISNNEQPKIHIETIPKMQTCSNEISVELTT